MIELLGLVLIGGLFFFAIRQALQIGDLRNENQELRAKVESLKSKLKISASGGGNVESITDWMRE